ncbi:MAG: DUF4335 domain-containing protein [Prochlorotrichaceae cyanobacterium]
MQLQRRYNLPNCTLLVDGLADTTGEVGYSQRLGVLMNLDCYLSGETDPLSGGIDFLTSLMAAVSHYAQQCLSGVPHPQCQAVASPIQIRVLAPGQHELQVYDIPPQAANPTVTEPSRRITLNTVQFFDLVEALDQLLADPLTLPQLTLPLNPLSRGDVAEHQPLIQRAAAPTIGMASLATAAALFFFAPVPEIQRPLVDPTLPGQEETSSSPQNDAETAANSPPSSETENAPINTRETLLALNSKIYDQIDATWTEAPTYSENLTYRVSVNAEGQIRGYRPDNDRSARYENNTPLPELLSIAPEGSSENLIDFKVVLTPQGRIEVNPWHGFPDDPIVPLAEETTPAPSPIATATASPSATPVATPTSPQLEQGEEITDPNQLKTLNDQLRSQLDKQWTISPSFDNSVIFRFEVDEAGRILNFAPASTGAGQYVSELGFEGLKVNEPVASGGSAVFRAVFTPKGVIEVSPWDGF